MAQIHSHAGRARDIRPCRYEASWTTVGRLAEETTAWRALAENAVEPNPLYAPNILIAAERHLRGGRPIPVVIVRDQSENGALVALAPVEARGWLSGFPGRALALFVNPYTSLTHPLVRRDGAVEILVAMLRFLAHDDRGSLLFSFLAEKRAFAAALSEAASHEGLALVRVDGWRRPAIEPEPGASGEQYLRVYVRKNRRSNNERRLRRLTDVGSVGFTEIMAHEPGGGEALEAFLALESAGWKGEAETALVSKDATRNFARAAFSGADASPRVRIRAMTLDGRPIAMALDLESQGVGYAFKAAYDPAYARHAPGLALDAHTAASVGEGFDIQRLDSLAQTEIAQEGVWRQEEPIGRYVLALSAQAPGADALAKRLRLAAGAKGALKEYARRSRAALAQSVTVAGGRKWALAVVLIGVSLPLVSLLTRHPG